MKKTFSFLIIIALFFPNPLYPKFLKKLRRSVTKRLKEAACETIPIAQVIRESQQKRKNRTTELEQALQQTQTLIEQLTKNPGEKIIIEQEETLKSLSVKLLTHFLQEKIDKKKKEELKQAIAQLNELKEAIEQLKNNKA